MIDRSESGKDIINNYEVALDSRQTHQSNNGTSPDSSNNDPDIQV